MRRVHPKLYWLFRAQRAKRRHSTRHYSAATHHVWRDQGVGRIAQQLLCAQVWRGHPLGAIPWFDFLRYPSRRWHHRLRCGYLLFGSERREVCLSDCPRHLHGHDVYARCPACGYRDYGSQSYASASPQLVQHRFHEFRPKYHLCKNQGIHS